MIPHVTKCVILSSDIRHSLRTRFHLMHFKLTTETRRLVQGRYLWLMFIFICLDTWNALRSMEGAGHLAINQLASEADNTQLSKATLTSAKRPSVKYFRSEDFPTVESPIRMSLEGKRREGLIRVLVVQPFFLSLDLTWTDSQIAPCP